MAEISDKGKFLAEALSELYSVKNFISLKNPEEALKHARRSVTLLANAGETREANDVKNGIVEPAEKYGKFSKIMSDVIDAVIFSINRKLEEIVPR